MALNLPNPLALPSATYIDGFVKAWQPDPNMQIGASADLLPMKDSMLPTIRWDEKGAINGMTPPISLGTKAPLLAMRTLTNRSEVPMYFAEQQHLGEEEFLNIRMAGALDKLAGRQLVDDGTEQLLVRLFTRIEWSRWQAMRGSLALDENGIKRTVTYSTTSISNPSTLWSVVASATPIANVQAWALQFRGKGSGPLRVYYNRKVATYLSQNAEVRDLVKANGMAPKLGVLSIGDILNTLIGDVQFIQYDEGYLVGGTFTPYIADNEVILVKAPPGGQQLGAWVSTPTVRNGGIDNPRPGRFGWTEDETQNSAVPKYCYGVGIYGIPILYFPQNVAKVQIAA